MKKEKIFVVDDKNLIKNWDWEKNKTIGIYPTKITYGSTKKVWWKCNKCGHKWQASPNKRRKSGCPCCAGKIVVKGINDLQTLFPEIAKKWHPTKNKKKPYEFTAFSNQSAWWVCDKDNRHVFNARINHLTKGEITCPVCANQKIIKGVNDLATLYPEILKDWNWAKNNSLKIYPSNTAPATNKKVWWKCNICEHEWQASVASRTRLKTGCPYCKRELHISFPEKVIAFYLSKDFAIEENKNFSWLGQSELDIYIDKLKLAIEYDGKVWHKDTNRDLKKDILCNSYGINLIRIREKTCPIYESSAYKIIRDGFKNKDLEKCIYSIYDYILSKYNIHIKVDINLNRDYTEINEKILSIKKQKSIGTSDLINSWNYKKNGKISPFNIGLGSDMKVWWICEKGHEWQATVSSRSGKQKCGCPVCAGQKVLPGENDLETLFPNLAKEWDYNKNTKTPNQIRPHDNRKYWWVCPVCHISYSSSPSHRTRNRGCPVCGRQKTIASHFKKVKNIEKNAIYYSIKEASQKTGINAGSISNCCRGLSKTAGGYHWKFVEND